MKLKPLFILLLVIAMGCTSQTNEINNNNSVSVETQITDTDETVDEEESLPSHGINFEKPPQSKEEMKIFLKAFITENQVKIFMSALEKYPKIKNDSVLAQFYLNDVDSMISAINSGMIKSHPHVVTSGDSEPADDWSWISNFVPYLHTECSCGECSSEAHANIDELLKKAKSTVGEKDDAFFEAMFAFFGTPESNLNLVWAGNKTNWYTMDGCDFCSYSNLGNGGHTKMIQKTIAVERLTDMFDEILKQYISFTTDLSNMHYGSPKDDVLKEISELIPYKDSTKFDLSKLEKAKTHIETNKEIQYNCAKGNCEYETF